MRVGSASRAARDTSPSSAAARSAMATAARTLAPRRIRGSLRVALGVGLHVGGDQVGELVREIRVSVQERFEIGLFDFMDDGIGLGDDGGAAVGAGEQRHLSENVSRSQDREPLALRGALLENIERPFTNYEQGRARDALAYDGLHRRDFDPPRSCLKSGTDGAMRPIEERLPICSISVFCAPRVALRYSE